MTTIHKTEVNNNHNPVRRRKSRACQQVRQHLQPVVSAKRNTSGADVLSALALPVTLPISAAWWLLCHPFETTLLACTALGIWMLPGVLP